jgi:hypothetical protein
MTVSNGQRSVRHHYAPRFYLERFTDQKGRIDAYQRTTGKRFKTTTANVAVETDLYTIIDIDGKEADHAEKIISDIETRLAPAFDDLTGGSWPPSHETRGLVANFIALQATRTRESFHAMSAITDRAFKMGINSLTREQMRQLVDESLEEDVDDEELDEIIADFRDKDGYTVVPSNNELVTAMLEGARDLVQPIADRAWFLHRSKKPLIVTSDAPVHLWSRPGPYGVGVLTAEEISLPIDPHHSLLLVADPRGFDETALDIPPRIAKDISGRVAASSYEWVFADPRGKALDAIPLPTEPRPLGYFDGQPMWRPMFEGPRKA